MLHTKFGENRKKGIGTAAKNMKSTFHLPLTLTFDISKIYQLGMNANILIQLHMKFDKAMSDIL